MIGPGKKNQLNFILQYIHKYDTYVTFSCHQLNSIKSDRNRKNSLAPNNKFILLNLGNCFPGTGFRDFL